MTSERLPHPSSRSSLRFFLLPLVIFLPLFLFTLFNTFRNGSGGEWIPVEGEITGAKIISERPGKPMWAISVLYRYEVNGRIFGSSRSVVSEESREVVAAKLPDWAVGRAITVYHNPEEPSTSSLEPEGDAESTAAITIILGLICLLFILLYGWALRQQGRTG